MFGKLLRPEAIFGLKMHKKWLRDRAPPGPMVSLQGSPKPLAGFKGQGGTKGEERKGIILVCLPPIPGSTTV